MADPTPSADPRDEIGTPLWVKVFAVIAVALVLLVTVVLLTGRGSHGPGRHALSGYDGGDTAPSSVIEHGPEQQRP